MIVKTLKADSSKRIKFLAGINRAVVPSHVTKLCESIKLMGVIRPVVLSDITFLSGKKETYIIDGQHLFTGLIRLGQDIPFITIPIKNSQELVEKIALLNASSKSWTMSDYVIAWGSIKSEYKILEKLYNTYDFELATIVSIAMNITRENCRKVIKKGLLEFKENQSFVTDTLDKVTDVFKHVPRMDNFSNRTFIDTYLKVKNNSKYNHKKFMDYIKKNSAKLVFATNDSASLHDFLSRGLI